MRRYTALIAILIGCGSFCFPLLMGDAASRTLAANSLKLCSLVVAISLPVGVWLAVMLLRTNVLGRWWAFVFVAAMLFVPLYLQASAWKAGFGHWGWFTLMSSGSTPLINGWRAAVWIHAMAAIPWVVLISGAGLVWVEREVEETALLDAAAWQVLWLVTLRRAFPAIVIATLWVFVLTLSEMTVTDLFMIRTFAEELYQRFMARETHAEVWQATLPGMLALTSLALAALCLLDRLAPADTKATLRGALTFSLGRWRAFWTTVTWLWVVVLVAVPLGSLIFKTGLVTAEVDGRRLRFWTASRFMQSMSESLDFADEYSWTILIGCTTATITLVCAVVLAWPARRGSWRATPALLITLVCLSLPGPLIGLLTIGVLNHDQPLLSWIYNRTIVPPVISLVIRCLPLVTLICWFGFRSLDETTLEAAALDGAGPLRRMWQIGLPQRRSLLLAAWLVGFALTTGEVAAPTLVLPPNMTTIAERVFRLLHYGVRYQEASISLGLLGLYLGIAMFVAWLCRYRHVAD